MQPASASRRAAAIELRRDRKTIGAIVFRRYETVRAFMGHLGELGGEMVLSLSLNGVATYTGGLFVTPFHRGGKYGPHKLAGHLTALARAHCMVMFEPDWHFGLVVAADADRGLASHKNRYQYQTMCLENEDTIAPGIPTDYVLPYSSKAFMQRQMQRDRLDLEEFEAISGTAA